MEGGTEPASSAMREISNYSTVRWIYDHCLDPDTDSKCADFGIAIRSLVQGIEELDRGFKTGQTDSDGHANFDNEDADYRAAKLEFVALLKECDNNAQFRYNQANELQGVVWSASIQAKNALLEKILLQTRLVSNFNNHIRHKVLQTFKYKVVNISLPTPPGSQDCTLVVTRDLSHPQGTRVQLKRQWRPHDTLYIDTRNFDIFLHMFKPLYAITCSPQQQLSIEICNAEGQREELYQFASLQDIYKFQRALTNYNVFSDFQDVDCAIPRVFRSSLVGKGSRVQIWWFDPEDNLEELTTKMIATTSRSNGSDSILSRLTRSSARDMLLESGRTKSSFPSPYPATPSEVVAFDANPQSNALMIVFVMGKNGLEYLCTQLNSHMYIDNTACDCKRHEDRCVRSVLRSGNGDKWEVKRMPVRSAEQVPNLLACPYGQRISSNIRWQKAESISARDMMLDFADAQQRRRFNQHLEFVLKLQPWRSDVENLSEKHGEYLRVDSTKGMEAKDEPQDKHRGGNIQTAVGAGSNRDFDTQKHTFKSRALQKSGLYPNSDIIPRSEGYKRPYSSLGSSDPHQLERVQQSGNERLSNEERFLEEERQRKSMQQRKESGTTEKQDPIEDYLSGAPTADYLQRFLGICVPRARAVYTWWYGFVTLQSARRTERVQALKTIGFPGNQLGVPHTSTPKSSSTTENLPSFAATNTSTASNQSSSNSVIPSVTNSNQSSLTASLAPPGLTLHTIYVDRKFGHFQNPIEVGHFNNDRDLFRHLNEVYRGLRRSWRAVTKLKSLRLTKFMMTDEYYVDVLYDEINLCDMMPNLRDPNYTFSWLPVGPMTVPIISQSTLWRKFCDPNGKESSGSINDGECWRRLPKRHRPLSFTSNEGYPIGWGLEFVEGWNWTFLFVCESFIAVATMIFSVLWATLSGRDDRVAVAFSIGQWMFGAGQVLYILIVLMSEYFMTWRY